MRKFAIAALALTLAGCAAVPEVPQNAYFVREGMVNAINPPMTAIWDMQVAVMDDEGNFDPAKMDPAKWAALLDAARALETEAQRMAAAEHYVVANPAGQLTDPPEGTDLVAIQARLTTNGAAYRAFAQGFATMASRLSTAATARDAGEVTMLANDMQPLCKSCHDVFWYPETAQ